MAELFEIAPWMLGPSSTDRLRTSTAERQVFNEEALASHFYTQIRNEAIQNGASEGQANVLAATRSGPLATMFARRTLETISEQNRERLENIKLQNQVRIENGLAAFTDAASKVTDWTSEEQEANLRSIASKNPIIIPTKAYEDTMNLFPKARQEKRLAESAQLRESTRADIAWLNANIKDAALRQRLDEIRLKNELGYDMSSQLAALKYDYSTMLQNQRQVGAETIQGIKGDQSLEQIEARHKARLEEIDAKISGTLANAPKMIRNTARVAALQSELRALESDIKLKYDPVKKAAALDAILKKYDVDVKSETIKTVPGTGLTPTSLPPVPADAIYGPPAPGTFDSEDAARAAGHKSGDVIILKGVGKVRLK